MKKRIQRYTRAQYTNKLEKGRERYHRNPDPVLLRSRKHNLKQYGLTLDQYMELVEKQANRCAICGKKDQHALCVDHDHKTNQIRGLLCRQCNRALGSFLEDPVLLIKAAQYLKDIASIRSED